MTRTGKPPEENPLTTDHPHQLQCMELWGGSAASDRAASVPGIDFYVRSRAFETAESGGDLYYVSMCGQGRIARFVLADVAGHGASVAPLASALRRLMRKHINTPDQSRMVRELNREFDELGTGRFATALMATYFSPTDHLILVNAGHPPPLLRRHADRSWSLIEPDAAGDEPVGIRNLPLGVIQPTGYDQFAIALEPRDTIVLYTDALPETARPDGTRLGTQGLLDLVSEIDFDDGAGLAETITTRLADIRGTPASDDDETVIVLSHNAGEPPAQSLPERIRVIGRMLGIGTLGPDDAQGRV